MIVPASNANDRSVTAETSPKRLVGTCRHLQSLVTQRFGEPLRIAAADANRATSAGGQLCQRGREHEPPATDDQHPVDRLRDLGENMT